MQKSGRPRSLTTAEAVESISKYIHDGPNLSVKCIQRFLFSAKLVKLID